MDNQDATDSSARRIRVNPVVFYGSGMAVILLAVWAILAPAGAGQTIGVAVAWISEWFGWFYILLAAAFVIFTLFLALSRFGDIKLGPNDAKPEFRAFTWAAMLFAAGIGTDLMFFSVAEPVTQYLQPPVGQGETVESARQATVWMLLHYGTTGWAMYALMGISLGYFAYRRGLPLSVRSCLFPLFGDRIFGPLGHAVDIAAVLGTIFGIATSLGISVIQLNVGLDMLFGIPQGLAAQIGLIVVTVLVATLSAISGVGRGIRRLSELNVILALVLGFFILVTGETIFLLNAFVLNINDYISRFPSLFMETFAFDRPTEWLSSWTLFFWAWWIAWAAFVGLFLARISRGRTIRQFVAGTLIIPFLYILMWAAIFGNAAIKLIRDGHTDFGQMTLDRPELGFYTLLTYFPAFPVVAFVATVVGLLFYITSADSGALVMGNLTSKLQNPADEARIPVRIFWALATGLLTLAMLLVGGIDTLQDATVVMGLPFSIVMMLLMIGLYKALHTDVLTVADNQHHGSSPWWARTGRGIRRATPALDWRTRLDRIMSQPSRDTVRHFLQTRVPEALQAVSQVLEQDHALSSQVIDASHDAAAFVELNVHGDSAEPFIYRIRVVTVQQVEPVVSHPGCSNPPCQLDVVLRHGSQGYDVMGYSRDQLIHDVLDQYQHYQAYLRLRL